MLFYKYNILKGMSFSFIAYNTFEMISNDQSGKGCVNAKYKTKLIIHVYSLYIVALNNS